MPQNVPVSYGALNEDEFNAEIEKGLSDVASGRVISAQNVAEKMHKDYGI